MNMTLVSERRKYPRVGLTGVVDLILGEMVRKGKLLDISPSGLRLECSSQLVNQLNAERSAEGLYPRLLAEFCLPVTEASADRAFGEGSSRYKLALLCQVSNCRRLNQEGYELGLSFVAISPADESSLDRYIEEAARIW